MSKINVLINDFSQTYQMLKNAQRKRRTAERRVHIVFNNAWFELFVDLILVGYLLAAGFATQVVLHFKSIPWFVSDVISADFAVLLNALNDPQTFFAEERLDRDSDHIFARDFAATSSVFFFFDELVNFVFFFTVEKFIFRSHLFWISVANYWRLPGLKLWLRKDLTGNELVIFKKNLNYLKFIIIFNFFFLNFNFFLFFFFSYFLILFSIKKLFKRHFNFNFKFFLNIMASYYSVRHGDRSPGRRVRNPRAGVEDVQGGCGRGAEGRREWAIGGKCRKRRKKKTKRENKRRKWAWKNK